MEIRPLQREDFDALHELFNPLAGLIPRHYRPDREQFVVELTHKSNVEKPDVMPREGEIALVAIEREVPVALAMGCYLAKDGTRGSVPAGTGVVRWVLAGPNDHLATRAVVSGVVKHLRTFNPKKILAMTDAYAPPFYDEGVGRLTSAWPWLALWLTQEQFVPSTNILRMWRPIDDGVLPSAPPEGVEIQVIKPSPGRVGVEFALSRTATLAGEPLAVGRAEARFGEEYVRSVGRGALFISELEVNEKHRHLGIGRALLRSLLLEAQIAGATEATILCPTTDFAAQSLLRTEGFAPIDLLWDFELKND